jgi:hypothetical protein
MNAIIRAAQTPSSSSNGKEVTLMHAIAKENLFM